MADDENTGAAAEEQDVEQTNVAEEEETEQEEMSKEDKLMAKLQEAVEVVALDAGPLRKKLDISIPRAVIDEEMGEQFSELKREAAIPGFRRGRAPLRLVEKRFGHEVGDDITAQLLSSGYLAAIKKMEFKTLGDPLIWASIPEQITDESGMNKTVTTDRLVSVDKALDHLHMPKDGDFTFACEVELRPEFELPSLKGIPVVKPTETITDDHVQAEINRLLAFRGRYVPIEDAPIQADDLVVGELKVVVDGKTVNFEANAMLAARDQRYAGLQLTGWGDALVGQKVGDTVKLEIVFPKDHDTPDLRDKQGTLELAIQDIKRLEIPELTAEMVGELGFDDESDLRKTIKTELDGRLQGQIKEAMRNQLTVYLRDNADFELPESLSQRQTDVIVQRRMVEMYEAGIPEAEVAKRADELRLRAATDAVADLRAFFVMDKIAEELDINVTEDEINGAINTIAAMQGKRFDRMRDELSKNNGMTALYLRIRDARILDALLESAEIT
ncbi:MAG: trigger factor [Phycisphaerae bacterium]|nr:trigger factor [Phycisphaerae bacterium]